MIEHEFEQAFRAWSRAEATEPASPALRDRVLSVPDATPERRYWLLAPWRVQSLFSATKFVVAGAIVALFGGFLLVAQPFERVAVTVPGAETEGLPPVTGPAGNGLIAFAREGDIYVGDPVTGESEALVAGPEYDMHPAYSPDGSRLAFIRYEADPRGLPLSHAGSLVVVRSDGSDERVIAPAPNGYNWAPDGRSFIQWMPHRLTFLDATGAAPTRTVELPTLKLDCCGTPDLMRPPLGDRILAWGAGSNYIDVVDADGSNLRRLIDEPWFTDNGVGYVGRSSKWSPDGSMIAFDTDADGQGRIVVMDADGEDPRVIGEGWDPDWSPDGARILSQRYCDEAEDCGARLTIIDVATGKQRELEATDTDHSASLWSPDGTSILYASGEQGRVYTVDVETGEVTELPWEPHPWSPLPSWQRVAAD